MSKKSRNQFIKQLLPYLGVSVVVLGLVFFGSRDKGAATVNSMNMQSIASNNYAVSADQISEFYVVSELANNMRLATAEVVNLNYNSLSVMRDIGQASTSIEKLEKPDIVDTSSISRGVKVHVVQNGETLATIAQQYGLTLTQIRWSNGLKNDEISPGQSLSIPSVPGIVYTVKEGETIDGLAQKYQSNSTAIRQVNDLENGEVSAGMQIILPGGQLPETERPEYTAPTPTYSTGTGTSSSSVAVSSYRMYSTSSNPMPWGWCTWYAWERRSQMGDDYILPGGLGNANQWAYALSGSYVVNRTPAAGAVMQSTSGYYGHVAIVDSVNADGSVTYSDMNGLAGWGRVGTTTISAAEAAAYTYIHGRL